MDFSEHFWTRPDRRLGVIEGQSGLSHEDHPAHRPAPERAVELMESRLPMVDRVWRTADRGRAIQDVEAERPIPERNTPQANSFLEPSFNFQNCAQWIATITFLNGAAMRSIAEQLNELTGTRESNRDSADVLRSLVTLKYGLRATGLSPTAFGKKYVDRSIDTGATLVRKWASGKTAAGPRSIARLESAVPGIYALYKHPVFDLLRNREIGRRRITSLLSRFQNPTGKFPPWWFGDEYTRLPELRFIPIVLRDDTSALWQRGDLDGFTVILGLVREAEAIGDTDAHIHRVADLYRAFAAVARIPWFRPYVLLLRWCVQRIHLRNPISFFWWRINWNVIYSQIRAPTFETARLRWSQDPLTGLLVEPRHPCSPAIKSPPMMIRNPLKSRRGKAT